VFAVVWFCWIAAARSETNEWQLHKRSVIIPERGEVAAYEIVLGTNRFSIVPPPRWRVTANQKDQTMTLTPRDFSATVTVELRSLGPEGSPLAEAGTVRARLTEKHPGAIVTREYKAPTGVGEGSAIDLDRAGKGKIRMSVRHVVVPVDGLLASFTLSVPSGRFDKFTFPFGVVLTSFKRAGMASPPPRSEEAD
jgi:hypothetical protein